MTDRPPALKSRRHFLKTSAAAVVAIGAGVGGYLTLQFSQQQPPSSAITPSSLSPTGPGLTAVNFSLLSNAFGNGERIPVQFTCEGQDVSPPLFWSGAPPATKTFALIMDDPDAPGGGFTHWVLYNIPKAATGLPTGVKKEAAIEDLGFQGSNDFGKVGYNGPCPPPGPPHRYRFRIYALDASFGRVVTRDTVLRAIENHSLGMAKLVGIYGR